MTEITHHLSPSLLLAYSAGALPEAFSLLVATHVSLCADCRAGVEGFDALGGAILDGYGTAPMGDESLAETIRRIAGVTDTPAGPPSPGVFPQPLQSYVGGDLEAVRWRPVGMGVRQAILPTARDATIRLLHIPAGEAVPDHGHRGVELTLVLRGAFSDTGGRFARGDVEIADETVEHTPRAEPGEPCICLAATDAPLRFNALLPRLAQPFLRI